MYFISFLNYMITSLMYIHKNEIHDQPFISLKNICVKKLIIIIDDEYHNFKKNYIYIEFNRLWVKP